MLALQPAIFECLVIAQRRRASALEFLRLHHHRRKKMKGKRVSHLSNTLETTKKSPSPPLFFQKKNHQVHFFFSQKKHQVHLFFSKKNHQVHFFFSQKTPSPPLFFQKNHQVHFFFSQKNTKSTFFPTKTLNPKNPKFVRKIQSSFANTQSSFAAF